MKFETNKIKKRIKIEKKVKKTIKITVLCTLLFALCIVTIITIQHKSNIKILTFDFYNIVSESMEPEIKVNDLIIVKKCNQNELNINDIITFKTKDNTVITHRIVNIMEKNDSKVYITKGDNNDANDDELIEFQNILGKYQGKIKGLGEIIGFLQNFNGIILTIIIILIIFCIKNIIEDKKEKRSKKRRKFDMKIKRDNYKRE